MKVTIVAVWISLLAACTTGSGTVMTQKDIAGLKKGVTTYQEVINQFGPPTQSIRTAETLYADYNSMKTVNEAENFIPVVGIFAGKHQLQTIDVTLIFDAQTNLLREIIDRERVLNR